MNQDVQGRLIFMTDPICSWCWGMLPELFKIKEVLAGRLAFDLRCAGLQVGGMEPLSEQQANQLITLWRTVAETTGQRFAFSLPADTTFVYHSELACRALQVCREHLDDEPWESLFDLQEAFYIHCRNVADPEVLFDIVAECGIDKDTFLTRLGSDEIMQRTRDEFTWCSERGIEALPTLFLDQGGGPELVSGGYATTEFLIPELRGRLSTH